MFAQLLVGARIQGAARKKEKGPAKITTFVSRQFSQCDCAGRQRNRAATGRVARRTAAKGKARRKKTGRQGKGRQRIGRQREGRQMSGDEQAGQQGDRRQ